jgi:hypothetical protein
MDLASEAVRSSETHYQLCLDADSGPAAVPQMQEVGESLGMSMRDQHSYYD